MTSERMDLYSSITAQITPAIELMATDWAKQVEQAASTRFLDGSPSPKQQRDRLHKAAPKLLAAAKRTLTQFQLVLEMDDPQACTQIEWEAEPLASLRAAIVEAEPAA